MDPYTGTPRINRPAYGPNIYPARLPTSNPVQPIPTEFTPGFVGSLPYQREEPLGALSMALPSSLGADVPDWGEPTPLPGVDQPLNLPHEAMPFYDTGDYTRALAPYGDYTGGLPSYSGDYYGPRAPVGPELFNPPPGDTNQYAGGSYFPSDYPADFGNIGPTPGAFSGYPYNPWDFNVTQAGTGVPDTGAAAGIAQNPYQYQLPSNPFDPLGNANLWGGGFTAPQYDPATLSRILGGTGLPPSGEDIPMGQGAWPDVAAGQPVPDVPRDPQTGLPLTGDPRAWTQGVIPGTQLSPRDLLNMARQPTDWPNSPLAALGRSLGNFFSQPGYSSPDYLRSIGYTPGQGAESLWPGGPGGFRENVATGGESPGDYYRVANGPNVIPFTGGVGGAGGSFFGGTAGNLATAIGFGGNLGGGGPVNLSMFRLHPWYISTPSQPITQEHSTNAPSGYRLNPAEHAWLASGGVWSGRQGPGIFSPYMPATPEQIAARYGTRAGPVPVSNVGSRHVPARQTQ
jgi:hypothetical protein